MKILDVSACSSTNILYTKSGTFQFLQDSHKETVGEVMKNIIGPTYDATKGYVLYGLNESAAGSATLVSAGAIFFNGEVYLSPAQIRPATSFPDVPIVSILTTQYTTNADPTDFSDGTPRNVHNIRSVHHTNGASGAGSIADWDNLIWLQLKWTSITAYLDANWADAGAPNVARFTKTRDEVLLQGGVANSLGVSASGTMLTLPSGYRPSQDVNFLCPTTPGSSPASAYVNITSAGVVSTSTSINPSSAIDISCIRFPVA